MDLWLPSAKRVDLSANHGYGPFRQPFLGVVVHVNQSNGNLAGFFSRSSDVCPNFQVYKDGSIEQYLPINHQPWCQTDGNQQYAAIETEGYTTEPWTQAQLNSVAHILSFYRDQMNLSMFLAEAPGQNGVGWHGMGGVAWGNHPGCPGDLRKAQRQDAIDIVTGIAPSGGGTTIGDISMADAASIEALITSVRAEILTRIDGTGDVTTDYGSKSGLLPLSLRLLGSVEPTAATVKGIATAIGSLTPSSDGSVDLGPVLTAIQALPAATVAALKEAL